MTPLEAIDAVYQAKLVDCTAEEYPEVRRVLQRKAGQWIDQGQGIRAQLALREVGRLDQLHNFSPW